MSSRYTVTEARRNFKQIMDEAQNGYAVQVERDSQVSALVDAQRLREHYERTLAPNVLASLEDGCWALWMPGYPIAVEAILYEDAISELVDALYEYAEDWKARLRHAPNHAKNWELVQLVDLSTEEDLKRWVTSQVD